MKIKPADAYKQIMTVAELLKKSPSAADLRCQAQQHHTYEKTQKQQAVVS